MTDLFQRRVRVLIGDLSIEGLRVTFKAKKTSTKDPNTCEISIYNLSPEHRASLQKVGTVFVLEAGYGGQLQRVFSGTVRWADSVREGPDWVSKVQSGDGEVPFRFSHVSESFAKGTPLGAVFRKVAEKTGLDVTKAVAKVSSKITEQFTQGYAVHGKTFTEIDTLLKGRGLEWSIQDGKLQVVEIGKPVPGEAVLLSASTGLVGSPEHGAPADKNKPAFLKVKSLLQPRLSPGALVQLDSVGAKGNFRVETVTHEGDTHGKPYYSDCELLPL